MDRATSSEAPGGVPSGPILRVAGVSKRFGSVLALADVSLDIAAGEFLCLLGPSGCGKTTLLRMLAGFEMPDSGTVSLDGRDISREPPHRRPLNLMFQSYALFPHLTAAANVGYGLRWTKLGRREAADRVAAMLRLVRLEEHGTRYPAQLSGGQRQRVALARALAREPRVLLLDEPLAALDPRLREETGAELKALQRRLGTTFVTVTHDQAEALAMADRIAVMDRGRLLEVAPARELYRRPRTRFAAAFLGHMNLLDGRVAGREGPDVLVATGVAPEPLRVRHDGEVTVGEAVAIGVRPEALTFVPRDAPSPLAGEEPAPDSIRGGPGVNRGRMRRTHPADPSSVTASPRHLLPQGEKGEPGPAIAGHILDAAFQGATMLYRVELAGGLAVRVSEAAGADAPRSGAVTLSFRPADAILLPGAGP